MIENKPSVTALRVAMRRAAHQLLDHPVVFADPVALRIIGPEAERELRSEGDRGKQRFLSRYLRAFLAVRSRVAEEELVLAMSRGVRQFVVLGAGLDTFAYRNPYPASQLHVYEVDFPATQAWKRARLEAAGIAIPETLTFVPVDFETETLAERLLQAGLDTTSPVFFSWLGVTPYLRMESVIATLAYIGTVARGGGGVVFDYLVDPAHLNFLERLILRGVAARVRRAGEPFKSSFDPARLEHDLRTLGFRDLVDLGPSEINEKYLAGRSDGLKVGRSGHIMIARA